MDVTIPNYEQMLEDFYVGLLRPGDVCVDVGAHVGRHSLPMARCVGQAGKVYAFEPIPRISQRLRQLIEQENLGGTVELRTCALADSCGEASFVLVHEAPEYSGLRTRRYDQPVTTETIHVQTQRLDQAIPDGKNGVRYIKIDCEGGELQVLRGASKLIRRDRPTISFECGDNSLESYDYDSADIYDFFDAHEYDIQSITRVPLVKHGFIDATARQEYWDYLAFPRI